MSDKIITTVGYDSYMNTITEIPDEVLGALHWSEENEIEWIIEGSKQPRPEWRGFLFFRKP